MFDGIRIASSSLAAANPSLLFGSFRTSLATIEYVTMDVKVTTDITRNTIHNEGVIVVCVGVIYTRINRTATNLVLYNGDDYSASIYTWTIRKKETWIQSSIVRW